MNEKRLHLKTIDKLCEYTSCKTKKRAGPILQSSTGTNPWLSLNKNLWS